MAIDAVTALAAANPDFPWADYDQEDQADFDDDNDLFEPDGAIDHLVVLHAGNDQADGGGAEGSYAEWSSSQVVGSTTGGIEVPEADGLRVFNSTTQPEDAGIGVIAHEFGHDLGLPDLYDSIGPTDTDVGWWDLMSTGSHSGELFQTLPTHMGAWSKYVLGWVDPKVLDYSGDSTRSISARPRGRRRAPTPPSRSTCRPSTSRWVSHTRRQGLVDLRRSGPRRRPVNTLDRRAGRPATSASGAGTTTRSRNCGTTASSRPRPTAAPHGSRRRSSTRRGTWSPPMRIRTAT